MPQNVKITYAYICTKDKFDEPIFARGGGVGLYSGGKTLQFSIC